MARRQTPRNHTRQTTSQPRRDTKAPKLARGLSTRDPRYGVHFFGPVGMTGGSISVTVVERTFDLGQGPQEVTATCRRYLSLLEDFVNEVEQH